MKQEESVGLKRRLEEDTIIQKITMMIKKFNKQKDDEISLEENS